MLSQIFLGIHLLQKMVNIADNAAGLDDVLDYFIIALERFM